MTMGNPSPLVRVLRLMIAQYVSEAVEPRGNGND
jgi:hypothetical protein